MVFEHCANLSVLEAQGDRVKVADVDQQRPTHRPQGRILQRPQDGCRSGVHDEERCVPGPGPHHRLHPGHAGRDSASQESKVLQARAAGHLLTQVVEPKTPVAVAGRGRPVVEDRDRDRVELGGDPESGQRLGHRVEVEVAKLESHGRAVPGELARVHHMNPHRLHPIQIVVKCPGGLRRGKDPKARAQMGLDRPMPGATTHGDAGQEQVFTVGCRLADPGGHQHGG